MEHEQPRHEKIRFRRDEITDLASFPSAAGPEPVRTRRRFPRRLRAIAVGTMAGIACLVVLASVAIYAVGVSGLGSEKLRVAAERALEDMAGVDIDTSMGAVRITLDSSRFLALEVRDVTLARASDAAPIANAGMIRFGFRFFPLLSGEVKLSSARLTDARIMVAALPAGGDWAAGLRNKDGLIDPDAVSKLVFAAAGQALDATRAGGDWAAGLRNADGLIDPDAVSKLVFAAAGQALDATRAGGMRRVALNGVEFLFPPGKAVSKITVTEAALTNAGPDRLAIDGRRVTLKATAVRDAATRRVTALDISAQSAAPDRAAAPEAPGEASGNRIGAVTLSLSGNEGISEPSRLSGALTLRDSAIDLGRQGVVAGDISLAGTLVRGSNKIQVDRLRASVGRSKFDFYGAVGPRPASGAAGEIPAYRFDMISRNSTIAPEGSPEKALNTYVSTAGIYQPSNGMLRADEIVVKSGPGEALGTASVQFVDGKTPGIAAALAVRDMPVAQVKQLWPWFSAPKARDWVLQKLFGGQVTDGRLEFGVPPGRLGNGVPLTGAEVSGVFSVNGTRFDTAGLIPPVRDAVGVVNFRGNDVDVAMTSGTVYLSDNRTVAASNGTLTIKNANIPPVIGALDIDVAGDAAAIAELASYDPINAMRFIGMSPNDLAGEVSGNVKADIPLQKGIDSSDLNWLVTLAYKKLSIAKPMDGQMVTDAEGTITVEPSKAVISTKARLGGIPAQIDLVEPIGPNGPERSRVIKLDLDDKAREKLVPGLSAMVSGPMKVQLDSLGGGRQRVQADLTRAELNIPWAGWTKGAGIDAGVSFNLENQDGKSTLSNFNLSGRSFGIQGQIALNGGALSEARFANVKLNRDDDVAITVKQSIRGTSVDISGASLDARSLIKQFTADTGTAAKAARTGPVTVRASVDTLIGFNDERLSNVKLDYSGSGDTVTGLAITATARSGGAIDIASTSEAGGRRMQMRSADAGAILRFLDIYENMEGGNITLALAGGAEGPMKGQVDARNFWLVNEPRLGSIVSTTPPGDQMSLNQAVKRDIDTSRVQFERGFTQIEKGDGYLRLAKGVLRGPLIGSTFQGVLYDRKNNMDMTGTFMPAYGLNRLFGQIPLIGVILGNGRDGGLIGVTFKLEGKASAPVLSINPLSAIAPGIFRSIFEFQ